LAVAKHGNRAASSKSGSADVLTALGVKVSALTKVSEHCPNEIGICFMFAPLRRARRIAQRAEQVKCRVNPEFATNARNPCRDAIEAQPQKDTRLIRVES